MANRLWILRGLLLALLANPCLGNEPTAINARPKISFSCGVMSPETPVFKKVETIYRQAFAQLGYDFEIATAPNLKRSLAEARYGGADGDCARVGFLNDEVATSQLLRVNVKILETKLCVWSTQPDLQLNSAAAIESGHFHLGYPHGSLVAEKFIRDHQLSHTQQINSPEIAIKMLIAKRIDLMLISPDIINAELKRPHLEGKVYNVGTLARYDVYPYLNEKHHALLLQLEAELKKLVPPQGINLQEPQKP